MKQIKNYGLMLIMAIAVALMATACGESQVDKYIAAINNATEQIKEAKTDSQLTEAIESLEAVEIATGYRLTEADKEKLYDALDTYIHAIVNTSIRIYDADPASFDYLIKAMLDQVKICLDKADTLGEFDDNLDKVFS